MFEDVINGKVRIILGSTEKLDTETNIQNKLIASHDLYVPWRPADFKPNGVENEKTGLSFIFINADVNKLNR